MSKMRIPDNNASIEKHLSKKINRFIPVPSNLNTMFVPEEINKK